MAPRAGLSSGRKRGAQQEAARREAHLPAGLVDHAVVQDAERAGARRDGHGPLAPAPESPGQDERRER